MRTPYKHNWPLIEPDILLLGDKAAAIKHNVPLATLQHYRWQQMGILSEKAKLVLANRELRKMEPVIRTPNLHFSMTEEQIINRNMAIKRRQLGKEHFEVWKKSQGPLSAYYQYSKEVSHG